MFLFCFVFCNVGAYGARGGLVVPSHGVHLECVVVVCIVRSDVLRSFDVI